MILAVTTFSSAVPTNTSEVWEVLSVLQQLSAHYQQTGDKWTKRELEHQRRLRSLAETRQLVVDSGAAAAAHHDRTTVR